MDYVQTQYVYPTDTQNILNYYWLGLAMAGMIFLGMAHVLVGVVMVLLERLAKHQALPRVNPEWKDEPGVSAMVTAFGGYLIALSFSRGASFAVVGVLATGGYLAHGLETWNLVAHGMPFAIGFLIGLFVSLFLKVK